MYSVEHLTEFVYLKTLIILLTQQTSHYRVQHWVYIEYDFIGNMPHSNLQHYSVPCAVCYVSTRISVLMIPAKIQCPLSWTREYYGYLTSKRNIYHRSLFECVDSSPEAIPGSSSNLSNVAQLHYSDAGCGQGLACPPYENRRILSCTVCTK